MKLEWDKAKQRANLVKHGIDFADLSQVFKHPLLIRRDNRKDYGEPRWIALGDLDGIVVVLVFTKRGDALRVISARKANKHERKAYQEQSAKAAT
jgi:uncharacterized DUF497 family protein